MFRLLKLLIILIFVTSCSIDTKTGIWENKKAISTDIELSSLSFDKNLKGDFNLENNLITKKLDKNYIYIGCQILSKKLFKNETNEKFSISKIWDKLIDSKDLYGYESKQNFYHLTNLEIFKKLKDL